MPTFKPGDPAPEFSLEDCFGNTVSTADLRGKKFLLYFFTSPGGNNWTRVALGYREHANEFAEKNLVVYGINDKDVEVAKNWVEEQGLPFSVLMDYGRTVGIAYGMSEKDSDRYVANAAEGRRPAVLVDEDGLIAAWEPDINSVEKVAELLASI